MSGSLIETIKNKVEGKLYDYPEYVEAIKKIIDRVYRYRYRGVWRPKLQEQRRNRWKNEKVEMTPFTFSDGSLIVNFHTFFNRCFEELENKKFLARIDDSNFANDYNLMNYLQKSLENLLQTG